MCQLLISLQLKMYTAFCPTQYLVFGENTPVTLSFRSVRYTAMMTLFLSVFNHAAYTFALWFLRIFPPNRFNYDAYSFCERSAFSFIYFRFDHETTFSLPLFQSHTRRMVQYLHFIIRNGSLFPSLSNILNQHIVHHPTLSVTYLCVS